MAAGDVSVSFPKVYRVSPNDGTVSGGVTIEDGAMKFDNVSNSLITLPNIGVVDDNKSYSFSLWFKKLEDTTAGKASGIIAFRSASPATLRGIGIHTDILGVNNRVSLVQRNDISPVTISTNINLNQYYHLVGVFNQVTNNLSFYKDGVFISSITGIDIVTPQYYQIGSETGISGASERINKEIDDTLIFNRALSQAEITQLYNQGRGQYSSVTNGLVAQYSGRDFAGTEAVPTKIYDTKEVGLIRQDTSFIDTAFSEMRVNANSKFLLVKGHKNQVYVTHIEEA